MITIYHNPRCRKSREALALLTEKEVPHDIRLYLKQPLTKQELSDLLRKLAFHPTQLIRKNETLFKEQYRGKQCTEDQWIQIMTDNPILIERPVVVMGDHAVIGRPISKVIELLEKKA